jgi:hypothetical protein
MRIYIIGNDGITLCREVPGTVNEAEAAGASKAGNCTQHRSAASGCWRCGTRSARYYALRTQSPPGVLR